MSDLIMPIGFFAVVLLLIGGGMAVVVHQTNVDAKAPIIETCVKHPATRSPFR